MIAHIDRVIRHLKAKLAVADQLNSEFVYITKREAEACLELAEAQDVIQETYRQRDELVRCKDCKWAETSDNQNTWCDHVDHDFCHDNDWFCADGERRSE